MTKSADVFRSFSLTPQIIPAINASKRPAYADLNLSFYPLCQLPKLIEQVIEQDKKRTSNDGDDVRTIRYLVDSNNKLWLALEGCPSKLVPGHRQMSANERCISAGNIRFSKDYKRIEWINHKSGDFSPPFNSTVWVLAILVANQDLLKELSMPLPTQLLIKELTSSGGDKASHRFETIELSSWIAKIFTETLFNSFTDQPLEIRTVVKEAPRPNYTQPFSDSSFDSPQESPKRPRLSLLSPHASMAFGKRLPFAVMPPLRIDKKLPFDDCLPFAVTPPPRDEDSLFFTPGNSPTGDISPIQSSSSDDELLLSHGVNPKPLKSKRPVGKLHLNFDNDQKSPTVTHANRLFSQPKSPSEILAVPLEENDAISPLSPIRRTSDELAIPLEDSDGTCITDTSSNFSL